MTIGQPPQTREAIAKIEIGQTTVSRGTVLFLVASFLLFIAVMPIAEVAALKSRATPTSAWSHLRGMPSQLRAQPFEPGASLWSRVVRSNRIVLEGLHAFEDGLADDSPAARALRPHTQFVLARWLGAGNELAYVGRDGWLFYRPDVDYVTGVPFLDRRAQHRRVLAANEWVEAPATDPIAAIAEFNRQLTERGITLIVVPTPGKATIHPERFTRRLRIGFEPPHNASYGALLDALEAERVLVFDPTPVIVEALRATSAPQYLATDSHWRPETMEAVAGRLAEFVRMHVPLPTTPAPYDVQAEDVVNLGDVGEMLDLPSGQTLYPRESVTVRRVVGAGGAPWRPAQDADVLLLGDSFSNIYSLRSMGWGDSAGLAEHLSLALQRPVDRIVQNDEGAFATRAMLQRVPQRLEGKRVVIYQFAERELAFGDWKIIR
jgi:alginate O-acetyltransferase complex protein AlgJ